MFMLIISGGFFKIEALFYQKMIGQPLLNVMPMWHYIVLQACFLWLLMSLTA